MDFKLNNIVVLILICISLLSCNNSNQKLTAFSDYKKNVSSKVFENFPLNIENFGNPYIISSVNPSITKRRYSGIFVTYQFENENELKKKIKEYSGITKHNIKIGGENSFIIPDSLTKNVGNRIPVPSLNDEINFLEKLVSVEESSFLIFNYDKGNFFKPPFDDVVNTDYEYQGYSNGCIADKENLYITYWAMVW